MAAPIRVLERRSARLLGWTLPLWALVLIAVVAYQYGAADVPPRLEASARSAVVERVRAALAGEQNTAPAAGSALLAPLKQGGPVVLRLWDEGTVVARAVGYGDRLVDAVDASSAYLRDLSGDSGLAEAVRNRARLQVDVVVARAPYVAGGVAGMLGIRPGIEGLERVDASGERPRILLPDELVSRRMFTSRVPISFIPDFQFGFDFPRAAAELSTGGRDRPARETADASAADYVRLRVDSFVEAPRGSGAAPLRLTRGLPPGPPVTAATLRAGAVAGGRYLAERVADNGRFVYQVDLVSGHATNPVAPAPYSLPRHAGTTYFLAELLRLTGEEFVREPLDRAADYLARLVATGPCRSRTPDGTAVACLADRGAQAGLGATSLTLVALLEYRRATGNREYDQLVGQLAEWILAMQREDGSFHHIFEIPRGEPDPEAERLYYSGQAALALARMYRVFGEERYLEATRRALDWLVDWYDFFVGGFFFGEEHWTCLAAEAALPELDDVRYMQFCRDYAEFMRGQIVSPGDGDAVSDLIGGHRFTPFVMPLNTPTGSRTEAAISAYVLTAHHGDADAHIRTQVSRSLQFLLRSQLRRENAWNVPVASSSGAVPGGPVHREVRIDYVQHVGSAMLRASLLPGIEGEPTSEHVSQ